MSAERDRWLQDLRGDLNRALGRAREQACHRAEVELADDLEALQALADRLVRSHAERPAREAG